LIVPEFFESAQNPGILGLTRFCHALAPLLKSITPPHIPEELGIGAPEILGLALEMTHWVSHTILSEVGPNPARARGPALRSLATIHLDYMPNIGCAHPLVGFRRKELTPHP
jgi:hypothetical protein